MDTQCKQIVETKSYCQAADAEDEDAEAADAEDEDAEAADAEDEDAEAVV